MERREEIAKFDRYLGGEMELEERGTFEKELKDSLLLKNKFNAYKSFAEQIEEGVEYAQITENLAKIHKEIYPTKRVFKLNPKLWIPIGIAASITLLIIVNPFIKTNQSENASSYAPLANLSQEEKVGAIESNQMNTNTNGDLNYGYDSNVLQDSLPFFSVVPHGTAFLISKDGYFLTSKHLVDNQQKTHLQQEDLNLCFEVAVVYVDSLLDFAILKASEQRSALFSLVPYELNGDFPDLGEEVFTLGYPKREIVFTKGVVSSEMGYNSDSLYYEISLPTNAGHSGAPLFNSTGNLIGIITAKNNSQQVVTYALKPNYIVDKIIEIEDSIQIDLNSNSKNRRLNQNERIKIYRPFIFELY